MYMDLTNLESIREFAKELIASEERLDCIVNNAAILTGRDFTADGIDLMMGVNFVGHFFLTTLLIDKLRSTPGSIARVVNVVCGGFKQGLVSDLEDMEDKRVRNEYDLKHVYRSSKLGLFLFNRELARKYRPFDVAAFCVDPGLVASSLYKHLPGFQGRFMSVLARVMFRSTEEGIQSLLYAIMARKLEADSGKANCRAFDVKNSEWTDEVTRGLWERTEELIRSKGIPFSLSQEAEEEDLGGGIAAAKVNLEAFAQKMQAGGGKQDGQNLPADDEEEEEEDEE
ncbi:short-chain dehydrogenase, putative [Ixodes scapularis]|uniref:Short-chain dehydrogenase, putative n=1 Tax=Ixodes scapularis TaxID=6945 RepID=B7PM64_IXOSC|nr:short-chain dehydrogenase, putative [Ixodes scapularis]|eukprot:XP_002434862.1 short-chain dehydrogenase, putative [Ixodes scapularis]